MEVWEYLANIGNVFFESIQVDQNVIEVDNAENIKEFTKAIVGVCLHRHRSIHETKGHDKIFKMSISGSECGFPFIAESNSQLIESLMEIELGVVLCILDAIEEF